MDYKRDLEFRDALLEFWKSYKWTSPLAITLTFREWTLVGGVLLPITPEDARRNVRHMLKVFHRKLQKDGLTKGKVLHRVVVFEGRKNQHRLHCHLMLDNPNSIDPLIFRSIFEHEWPRTLWGHQRVTVEPCYDPIGWLAYILKLATKENYADSIDWLNCA